MSPRRRSTPDRTVVPTVIIVALVAVIVGLTGYVIGRGVGTPTSSAIRPHLGSGNPSPSATPSLADVARTALSKTVTVEALRSADEEFGTGWLYDGQGDFVTNAHVVDGALVIRLRDRSGTTHVGLLLGLDRDQDIAVVRAQGGFAGPPLIPSGITPAVSEAVVAIASGRATGHADVTVELIAKLHAEVPVKGNPEVDPAAHATTTTYHDMINIGGAQIFPGNSGGPVMDASGRVIGIVTLASKTGDQAFAIPLGRVLAVIQGLIQSAPT